MRDWVFLLVPPRSARAASGRSKLLSVRNQKVTTTVLPEAITKPVKRALEHSKTDASVFRCFAISETTSPGEHGTSCPGP